MTNLVAYRQSLVTPDTAEAMRKLELAAKKLGEVQIQFKGVEAEHSSWEGVQRDPGPLGHPAIVSMRPTGREVYLGVRFHGAGPDPMRELATLWGLAIPLGFMPWDRYPMPSKTAHVFHYLGPWTRLVSFLHGEGRGELAWPSLCAAAQLEVGTWEGDRPLERMVQMHLHRLGIHCGPVDGIVSENTLQPLRALGMGAMPLTDAVGALAAIKTPVPPKKKERQTGYLSMKGRLPEAFVDGGVQTTLTKQGLAVSVDGPGRLVLLFGEN